MKHSSKPLINHIEIPNVASATNSKTNATIMKFRTIFFFFAQTGLSITYPFILLACFRTSACASQGNSALPYYPPPVILLDTAGSMQRLDPATSLRYALQ
ncbi:MAG: hypothetical protein LBE22_01700 [Azoarcus sp.]|jgi:hypothetical protein|nr:hypothetical protein [Azoarcus sp.]